ncbi:hypothetical protein NC653_025203 [Populus alba x Populus x berolinensis]|uniref:Uncharacterized protein n=1 Tax=Populus alba x Populus x berolinensis TaxID=444605 RepID=A0AAD6Q8S2_9ROSI|nr:hypothetical protein NC653_025203 [Populus alba x Populus x berolinensis]
MQVIITCLITGLREVRCRLQGLLHAITALIPTVGVNHLMRMIMLCARNYSYF